MGKAVFTAHFTNTDILSDLSKGKEVLDLGKVKEVVHLGRLGKEYLVMFFPFSLDFPTILLILQHKKKSW